MRIFARMFWIAAFVMATYSWMVAFEHGFAWKGFRAGFEVEWRNLGTLLSGKPLAPTEAAPPPVAPK